MEPANILSQRRPLRCYWVATLVENQSCLPMSLEMHLQMCSYEKCPSFKHPNIVWWLQREKKWILKEIKGLSLETQYIDKKSMIWKSGLTCKCKNVLLSINVLKFLPGYRGYLTSLFFIVRKNPNSFFFFFFSFSDLNSLNGLLPHS